MGTWGGAERVVQPTDRCVWSVFVSPQRREGRKEERACSRTQASRAGRRNRRETLDEDGSGFGIFAQRYDATGNSLAVSKDRLLLSNPHRTVVVDGAGAVLREIPHGGTSLSDADGNLYLFGTFHDSYDGGTGPVYPTAQGGNVYISKYDSDFRPLYTRVTGTTSHASMRPT